MYKDIHLKLFDLFQNCSPLYSNLVLLILIILGSFLRLNTDTFENYKHVLFITIGVYIIHFSIVFILCKKKYKKLAYFIAYFPFLIILVQIIIVMYEINTFADNVINNARKIEENKTK